MPPKWNVMVSTCPSRTSLARIANKWTAMIVIALSGGPLRFGEVRKAADGISGKVLADTLRELERDGLVTRTSYDEMPPRVEYELTQLGSTLREPLSALARWSEAHISEVLAARGTYDARGAETVDAGESAVRSRDRGDPRGAGSGASTALLAPSPLARS